MSVYNWNYPMAADRFELFQVLDQAPNKVILNTRAIIKIKLNPVKTNKLRYEKYLAKVEG